MAVTGNRPETVDAYNAEAQGQAARSFALVSDAALPSALVELLQTQGGKPGAAELKLAGRSSLRGCGTLLVGTSAFR